jgi:threonine dehydratase
MQDPTVHDVFRAAHAIRGLVRDTPLEPSPALDAIAGGNAFLKLENLQLTGSFKLRGALNCVLALSPGERARGLLAASSGNHAQGVALAARHVGCPATVVVPRGTAQNKLDNCRRLGAEVIEAGRDYDEAEVAAKEMAAKRGATLVHAFADPRVIAGQGTVALEMLAQAPDLDLFLVPAGGGGLIGGMAVAIKAVNPRAEVIGVQSFASPVWYHCFRAGKLVDVPIRDSIAEGLHGGIGDPPFSLVKRVVDDFVLVEEEELARAIPWFVQNHRQLAEPSGVAALAAVLYGRVKTAGRRVGIVISGGNVDVTPLARYLTSHGAQG